MIEYVQCAYCNKNLIETIGDVWVHDDTKDDACSRPDNGFSATPKGTDDQRT